MESDIKTDTPQQEKKNIFSSHKVAVKDQTSVTNSLEEAFQNTRHNHQIKYYIWLALFFVAIFSTAVIAHIVMQEKEQNIHIEINEFKGLELQKLLLSSDDFYRQIQLAKTDLKEFEWQHLQKIEDIEDDYQRLRSHLRAKSSPEKFNQEIQKIEVNHKNDIATLNSSYQDNRQIYLDKIKTLEDKTSSNSNDLKYISPEQQLYELKMNQVKEYYEEKNKQLKKQLKQQKINLIAKYNPTFTNQKIVSILSKPLANQADIPPLTEDVKRFLINNKYINKNELIHLESSLNKQNEIINKLADIPFINSPQQSLIYLENLSNSMSSDLRLISQRWVESIQIKDSIINQQEYFLSQLTRLKAENGYILDARNPKEIAVFIDKAYQVKEGDTAMVFNKEGRYLSTIQFYNANEKLYAKQNLDNKGSKALPIRALDRVLLDQKPGKNKYSGNQVKRIQQALIDSNYHPLQADGQWDYLTYQAVINFQKDNVLTAISGQLTPLTSILILNTPLHKLKPNDRNYQPQYQFKQFNQVELREFVLKLQLALLNRGMNIKRFDGHWKTDNLRSLILFQHKYQLKVTAKLDKESITALFDKTPEELVESIKKPSKQITELSALIQQALYLKNHSKNRYYNSNRIPFIIDLAYFQKSNQLPVTGEPDSITLQILFDGNRDGDGEPENYITRLQTRLIELSYDVGEIDGYFGPKTEAGLKKLQLDHKIEVSGKIDEKTRRILFP